ncbi:MAG: tetratricopeptide repeat protein, partial [Candidatus Desantisbacteria bacterium]
MNKPDMPAIFRKIDEIKLPRIFHQLRLFKDRGCLFFISCETPAVEDELTKRVSMEMANEFDCHVICLSSTVFNPFSEIKKYFILNPQPRLKPLFLFKSIVSLKEDAAVLVQFFQGINLNRDKIGQQQLDIIFFVDDLLLNQIIFKSPDFYTFKSGIFRFRDDAMIHREIAHKTGKPSKNEQRLADLSQTFKAMTNESSDQTRAELAFEIGNLYYSLSNLQNAMEYYEIALPLLKKINDQANEASTLGNIGAVYQNMGELDRALKYHQQALGIHKQIGDLQGEATILGNIGLVYQNMGELDRALKYHQQSLGIHKQIGDLQGEATQLGNIGAVYQNMGELDRALKYHQQALEIHKQIGYLQGEAT